MPSLTGPAVTMMLGRNSFSKTDSGLTFATTILVFSPRLLSKRPMASPTPTLRSSAERASASYLSSLSSLHRIIELDLGLIESAAGIGGLLDQAPQLDQRDRPVLFLQALNKIESPDQAADLLGRAAAGLHVSILLTRDDQESGGIAQAQPSACRSERRYSGTGALPGAMRTKRWRGGLGLGRCRRGRCRPDRTSNRRNAIRNVKERYACRRAKVELLLRHHDECAFIQAGFEFVIKIITGILISAALGWSVWMMISSWNSRATIPAERPLSAGISLSAWFVIGAIVTSIVLGFLDDLEVDFLAAAHDQTQTVRTTERAADAGHSQLIGNDADRPGRIAVYRDFDLFPERMVGFDHQLIGKPSQWKARLDLEIDPVAARGNAADCSRSFFASGVCVGLEDRRSARADLE